MATYELEKIMELWGVEKLSSEQAIGHVLQHLLGLRGRLGEVEKRLRELERREEAGRVPPL